MAGGRLPGPAPFSIKIFLADGTPDGLRVVEKTNWTGQALCFARTQFATVRQRDELGRPGVYVLSGPSESERFRQRVYIGEADELVARLRQHVREKEFWTQVVAFTSKDDDLNKAHVRYLEARLIAAARACGRADLENTGGAQTPRLSEPEAAYADAFLADMLLIYPLVGIEAFETLETPEVAASPRLYLVGDETLAEGRETPDGFLVFSGARARGRVAPSLRDGRVQQRQRLIGDGVLAPDGDGYRLVSDFLFSAPSAAATVLLGRSANGRARWKDASGRTLAELQDADAGPSAEDQ
ncbi:MAG: GIY-YIG nuclease family protein [Thermoleophilia bacterium]